MTFKRDFFCRLHWRFLWRSLWKSIFEKECWINLQEWSSKKTLSAILQAIFKSCLWASLRERSSSMISKMISKRNLWANLQEWSSKQSSSLISKIISKRDLQKQSPQSKKWARKTCINSIKEWIIFTTNYCNSCRKTRYLTV